MPKKKKKEGKEEDEGSAETCHGVLRLPGPRIPSQGVEGGWEGDPVRDREDPAGNGHPAGSSPQDRGIFGGGMCGRQSQPGAGSP